MSRQILGIHHVTAFCADPQRNIDFYTGVLGLRLVKVTVNFDDPTTYHFYYGDGAGSPGSVLTFFAWPLGRKGRVGTPQVTATAFAVPVGSLDYWRKRLAGAGVRVSEPRNRFGEQSLPFEDPDGLRLELVPTGGKIVGIPWRGNAVPAEHSIRSIRGITLAVEASEHTASLLTKTMGFNLVAGEEPASRFKTGGGGSIVDVECLPGAPHGAMGVGVVHHVAWRVADQDAQAEWRKTLVRTGANVSPFMDRKYFRSIYFREPGGVLFEIATDPPGFAVDEAEGELGTKLMLPDRYEPARAELERILPKVRLPSPG